MPLRATAGARKREHASKSESEQASRSGMSCCVARQCPRRARARERASARARVRVVDREIERCKRWVRDGGWRARQPPPLHWGLARKAGRPASTACVSLFQMMLGKISDSRIRLFMTGSKFSQHIVCLLRKVDSVDFEKSTNLTLLSTCPLLDFDHEFGIPLDRRLLEFETPGSRAAWPTTLCG